MEKPDRPAGPPRPHPKCRQQRREPSPRITIGGSGLNGNDEVSDDIEDARIRELAQRDDVSDSYEDARFADTGEDVVSE